jgi:hypothetical protein
MCAGELTPAVVPVMEILTKVSPLTLFVNFAVPLTALLETAFKG